MCKHGTLGKVELCKIDLNGLTEEQHRGRAKKLGIKVNEEVVDLCIATLVQVLNAYGIQTVASCCGHGKVKTASIRIHPKHVKLSIMKDTFTVWLEFPYPGKKESKQRGDVPIFNEEGHSNEEVRE